MPTIIQSESAKKLLDSGPPFVLSSAVDRATRFRRFFGSIFLILASGMLILGQSWLRPILEGVVFVVFWLCCFVFTGLAMLMALLDFRAIRKRAIHEQRDLVKHAFHDEHPEG